MGPEAVVLPAEAISQELRFCHEHEQLGVQEVIGEPAVQRLGKVILP